MKNINESIGIAQRYGALKPRVLPKTGPRVSEALAIAKHMRDGVPNQDKDQPAAKPGVAPVPN